MSLEPPPVKISSLAELTASVTKALAIAPLTGGGTTLLSAKTWSQSCVALVVTLPSSSNTLFRLGVTRSSRRSTRSQDRCEGRLCPSCRGTCPVAETCTILVRRVMTWLHDLEGGRRWRPLQAKRRGHTG